MNTTNATTERQSPTFEEFLVGVLNTRRIDVRKDARDIVLQEMGHSNIAAIYAMISLMQLPLNNQTRIQLHEGLHYLTINDIGEVIKHTRTRLSIIPSESFREWIYKLPYLRNDKRHKGSYLVPVGCLGWVMLLTDRDGVMTFDHYPSQLNVAPIVFAKRGVLEALRRCLKSRNVFEPVGLPDGKVGFKLTKSSLTLGNVDFLDEKLTEAIYERLTASWSIIMGNDKAPDIHIRTLGERWNRKWEVILSDDNHVFIIIHLIDKTFYAEI